LRAIRDNVDAVQANIVSRGSAAFADAQLVKQLYERSVTMEYEVSQQRKARNALTKKFGGAKTQEEKESVHKGWPQQLVGFVCVVLMLSADFLFVLCLAPVSSYLSLTL